MSNRQVIERALTCFADPARRESYFDLYSPDVVLHGYDGVEPGMESVKAFYAGIWAAFPDAQVLVEDTIEADDKCVLRFTMTGTHRGPFMGLPATGKPFRMAGITILRFEGGKCVERWSVADFLSLLMQLGAFPPA